MIIVRRMYVPNPGEGTTLLKFIKQVNIAFEMNGLPKLNISKTYSGYHGTIITDQLWDSIFEYEKSRDKVRSIKEITSIFKKIYGILDSTHHTEILSLVD